MFMDPFWAYYLEFVLKQNMFTERNKHAEI